MQVVETTNGYVSGVVIGEPGKEVAAFRGIPYAAPPVGELRWRPPQPAKAWKGIRECTRFTAMSPQVVLPNMAPALPVSEDCLYLNVITPARQSGEKLPVMVWMHGGGYAMGCGSDMIWNNYRLPHYGVVVVTLTHRLGPIGLLAHPWLSAESDQAVSGNYLFLDLIASLRWVQDNVAAFGGDPGNVTIFGESGGGAKVSVMMACPLAGGLFHKAICESGTASVLLTGKSRDDSEVAGRALFDRLGVKSLAAARAVSAEKLIEAARAAEGPRRPSGGAAPAFDATADGWVLPDIPRRVLLSGAYNAVPLMVSANLGELTGPGPLVIPSLVGAYVEMLDCGIEKKSNGYACIFDQVPAAWRRQGCISVHSIELPYVFGDWDDSTAWWKSVSMLAFPGREPVDPGLDSTDRAVSETMMGLWTSFARAGKPVAKGIPEWPAYSRSTDQYLYVSGKSEVRTGFSLVP